MNKLIALTLFISLASCQWEAKKPSFLVIAVDSLGFESVHCNESEKWQGFKTVCDEMIRFTHAYTPSVMATPALASLLTGRYPFEHGVWNNGPSFLSAKTKTAAEIALDNGYRTSFISGGPPIWKKSALDQGFESFDDNIFVDYGKYYRPAYENFRLFQDWVNSGAKEAPFFSFIFLSDLQFADIPTAGNDGYAREATYDGQLHAVDESLANLFRYIKAKNLWKNTWIFVVGLNGQTQEGRLKNSRGTDLFHENTNTALFVKPPQRGDEQFSWTIDSNVILPDIGRTIIELLNQTYNEDNNTLFKVTSLKDTLLENKDSKIDRILLMESGWPQWRKLGRSLFSLQKDNYLLLYENPPKLYNTLIDRNEVYPINVNQASAQILTQTAQQLVSLLNSNENPPMDENIIEKFRLAHLFFRQKTLNGDVLYQIKQLAKKLNDEEIYGWIARYYLEKQDWKNLLALASDKKQSDWAWIASKNQNLPNVASNNCVGIFDNLQRLETLKDPDTVCNDPLVLSLIAWIQNRRKPDMVFYRDAFIKSYRIFKTDLEIQRLNMENGYVWDVAKDKVARPQNIEMILSLGDLAKYKKTLDNEF